LSQDRGQFDLRAMWSHEIGGWSSDLTARLASANSDARFRVNGLPVGRDTFTLGAGVSAKLKRNLSLFGDYNVELRGVEGTQQAAITGLRLEW